MSTKEIVTIAGGGDGMLLSSAMWELFCQEYGIDADGRQSVAIPDLPMNSFFEVTEEKIIPRTVMIYPHEDLSYLENDLTWNSKLYHPDSTIALKNNYNETFFTQGYYLDRDGLEKTLQRIRVMCEKCSNLDGFIICRQYSEHINGFISKLLEELTDYGRKTKIDYAKVPSPTLLNCHTRTAVLNTFFTISDCIKNMDCCIIADDFAMKNIYTRMNRDISNKYFYNRCMYNRILAQAFSGITSPLRFRSKNNWSLDNYKVLVPYKEIPFVTMAYAPLVSSEKLMYYNQTIQNITNECLENPNQMLSYDPRKGAYISSLLVYRGLEVIQKDIVDMLADINKRCKQGRNFRRANGIENPFQAESVRTMATALKGGVVGCPKQLVASCSNNTDLYHYWKALAVNVKDALTDKTRYLEEQLNTFEQLKSCYTYINETMNVERNYKEDLNGVNECLVNMLDKYTDFDCNIQHDRRIAGFMYDVDIE